MQHKGDRTLYEPHDLQVIARESGALAMVAIDQRESLRTMFREKKQKTVSDQLIIDFKKAVAEILAGEASAMLFDRHFGLPALQIARAQHPKCGRILAADRLIQEPEGPVTDTDIDTEIDLQNAVQEGAAALKLLLLWKGSQNSEHCRMLGKNFMGRCRSNRLIGIVEAMVRPPDNVDLSCWDREKAILDAAEGLAECQPDLYKGEVPLRGRGRPEAIQAQCEKITSVLPCPWVILSQGVEASDFPDAVRAACLGGASGFLAGRAIWADTIGSGDYRMGLRETALTRLRTLVGIVDSVARPWTIATNPR